MKKLLLSIRAFIALFAVLLLVSVVPLASAQYTAPHTRPGPAADVIEYTRVPIDLAPEAIRRGDIDIYQFGLRAAQAKALVGVREIRLYPAASGLIDIVLNPAPAPAGELNPLTSQRIRFALNYVFNREFLVRDVFGGLALPMVTFLSSVDPDYTTIFDIVAKYDFKYDPALAASIVDEEMKKLGAEKVAGKWVYRGKPVTLKFIIRIEDERRQMGDSFAVELEKLGFTVERIYLPFGPAIQIIYGTDPKEFQWHLYTEGWGKTAVDKYDVGSINQFNAPWYTFMPGWAESGFWQYENKLADELGQKIYRGEFKSKEERDRLYRQLSELGITESIRIWGVTRLDSYITTDKVVGITNDVGAGLRAWHVLRNAYVPGKATMKVGHLWVWTERTTWNPVGGFRDVYSVDPAACTCDPAIYPHPFNGLPIPIRASFDVVTAGPDGTLDVPADAVVWDAANDRWVPVGAGVKAKSKVTLDYSKYFVSKWHHGIQISMADLLFNLASLWDVVADPAKSALESAVATTNRPFFTQVLKGLRILPDNRVESYIDYWHFNPNYIASQANLWVVSAPCMTVPWEIRAAMDKLVFEDRRFAYSDSAATARGVPWLSLVLRDHASAVASAISALKTAGYYPEGYFRVGDRVFETRENTVARYDASLGWHSRYSILWISNGPFMLTAFDSTAQYLKLEAFRDPTYPYRPGDNFWGLPPSVEIANVGKSTITPGGESLLLVDVRGPAPLYAIYLVKDPVTGEILQVGSADKVTPTRFIIRLAPDFTKTLRPGGLYEFTIAAYSDEVASVAAVKEFVDVLNIEPLVESIEVVSKELLDRLGTISRDLAAALSGVQGAINSVSDRVGTVNDRVGRVESTVNTLTASATTINESVARLTRTAETILLTAQLVLVVSVIALVMSVLSIMRRPRPS
ncbi:MAG: ABC transporter substrate-binding protein [Candidatus Caldarchaeum sp.]|nr:ABC transporter substrate-binding protein [Candidatus Caldarchaeum sp.]